MNFLAHMFLTYGNEKLTVGNFIADFIRNRDLAMYDADIIEGVMLHRHIDYFTDHHPVVLESTRLIRARHHKYSPVVIDVFYDYVLSQNWDTFSDVSLRTFSDDIYHVLAQNSDEFPIHLQDITERMIADDFLIKYGSEEGMEKTFARIGKRVKFKNNFLTAFDDLEDQYDVINQGFLSFFPDLIESVSQWKANS